LNAEPILSIRETMVAGTEGSVFLTYTQGTQSGDTTVEVALQLALRGEEFSLRVCYGDTPGEDGYASDEYHYETYDDYCDFFSAGVHFQPTTEGIHGRMRADVRMDNGLMGNLVESSGYLSLDGPSFDFGISFGDAIPSDVIFASGQAIHEVGNGPNEHAWSICSEELDA
jgi:hypothetical protein